MTQPPGAQPPSDTAAAEQDDQGLLEGHRDFLLRIDDTSRLGYTLLGIGTLVAVVLLFAVTGTAVFSLSGLALAVGGGLVTLIVGRIFGLSRQDAHLRKKVEEYCKEHHLKLDDLIEEADRRGRYQFLVKLFVRVPRPPGRSG